MIPTDTDGYHGSPWDPRTAVVNSAPCAGRLTVAVVHVVSEYMCVIFRLSCSPVQTCKLHLSSSSISGIVNQTRIATGEGAAVLQPCGAKLLEYPIIRSDRVVTHGSGGHRGVTLRSGLLTETFSCRLSE